MPNVPGTSVQLGGRELILAPLNAAACKQYREPLAGIFGSGSIPDIELVAQLVHCSAVRNHPDVTPEWCVEYVDLGNYVDLLDIVVNVSGMVANVGKLMQRMGAAANPSSSTT